MELSNPFGTLVPRKMSPAELARSIAQDIAAELDAVALYQAHIDGTDNARAQAILAHIRDEEKEHVAEFMSLLKLLDPVQAEKINEGDEDIMEVFRLSGIEDYDHQEAPSAPALEEDSAGEDGEFTVGSLINGKEAG